MSVSSEETSEHALPSRRRTAAEQARAATRARLLASGMVMFAERGLHGVTTHDIAGHAGLAAGTFYNHFQDKAALFREITGHAMAELRTRLDAGTRDAPTPRDAVRARAEALVGFAEDNRDVIRILFSGDADAAVVESDVLDELAASIAEERRKAIEAGAMPAELDPVVLSQALVGMWARVVAWWAEDPTRAERDAVIETLTRIQLSGTHPL